MKRQRLLAAHVRPGDYWQGTVVIYVHGDVNSEVTLYGYDGSERTYPAGKCATVRRTL